jgi:hypothetical protein
MPVGTVGREMLKAWAAIIEYSQHARAGVMQHDAVNLRVGADSARTARC